MSETTLDLRSLVEAELGPFEVLAPGALDSQVGKTVPVTVGEGENKKTVGSAELFKDSEGNVCASIQIALPKDDESGYTL